MEAEKGSTPCWEWCEVYGQFKEGERVKEKELCPNCPVRDFQAVLKRLTADVLYDEAPCKDKESPVNFSVNRARVYIVSIMSEGILKASSKIRVENFLY